MWGLSKAGCHDLNFENFFQLSNQLVGIFSENFMKISKIL